MASRNLSDLHPDLQPLANMFLRKCKGYGLNIIVTCTYRSNEEQDVLYAQGRKNPGNIVTNAWGGKSEHNFTINGKPASKAFDIAILSNGKLNWAAKSEDWQLISKIWMSGIKEGNFYLDWYGKPNSTFYELPHFCLKVIS